jgi:hypothetical protein
MAIEAEIDNTKHFTTWTVYTYEDVDRAHEHNDWEQDEIPVPIEGTMVCSYNVTKARTSSK